MKDLRILFVEDSITDVELASWELEKNGYVLTRKERVQTREDLRRAMQTETWDLIISDYSMPSFTGLEALKMVREMLPDLPYIMVSGTIGEDVAVMVMKAGANDYLMKGHLQRLAPAVAREMRDVVERKRTEEALRKSEEQLRLAQRMETVGRLAGGVAHDFNNILSVVSGYANLLQMKLAKTGSAPRELVEIEKAVVKATALVRQLLTFSRRQVVQPQVLDLGTVATDSLSMLQMVVGEDITLETSLARGLGRIKADKSQIEQVIMNLAVNAKDAMPKGGTLYIELAAENLGFDHFRQGEKPIPGKYLSITMRDTGHGIPADILPRIFEPFFTTKSEGRGTGLGLSTVYAITQQIGGNLRVESLPMVGTTFTVYFPCVPDSEAEEAELTRPERRRMASKGETILLVEDDTDLRKLTKDILVLEGYHVLEPITPQEALGFAQSKEMKIDMLLTDLVMPRMNGKDLAEAILVIRPELRVMYMSGYAPEHLMPDANLISELCFLEKPFSPAKLLGKIRGVLDALKVEKQL
ncbi:MAG: sensory box histidine kinase/response regulator [Fibrobacteres bacterium]|nr:sensory box histidine kinase/response regulator [Fibrobacterota bacterium]